MSACPTCGHEVEPQPGGGRPRIYCAPEPGQRKSSCALRARGRRARAAAPPSPPRAPRSPKWTPEQFRERERERSRINFAALMADPDRVDALNAVRRAQYAGGSGERARAAAERASIPTGSVLACAAAGHGRDLLARLTALAPRGLMPDARADLIAEAALLTLEGRSVEEAIAAAGKAVRRSLRMEQFMVPVEDCRWL